MDNDKDDVEGAEPPMAHLNPENRLHEPPSQTFTSVDLGVHTGEACYHPAIRGRTWNPEKDELVKGMSFNDKETLKRFLQVSSIRTHQQYEVTQTNSKRWELRCKLHAQTGCKWELRSSKKKSGRFEVTSSRGRTLVCTVR